MRLSTEAARTRFAAARSARLATITPAGRPHLVPIAFALAGDALYTAVDAKPKRTHELQRLANIAAHPDVAVLADQYTDDWSQLWWVRADGAARIVAEAAEQSAALDLLTARYPQYATQPPPGPILAIDVERWSGWSAT